MKRDWIMNFEFDRSMIVTTIMLAIFPPIGLIMLFKKLGGYGRGRNTARRLRNMGVTTMLCSLLYLALHIGAWGLLVLACGLGLTVCGEKKWQRERRFRQYLSIIGGRSPVAISEIGARCRESDIVVERELQAMIDQGYFGLTTYIDHERGCIVLDGMDDAAWRRPASHVDIHIHTDGARPKKTVIYAEPERENPPQPECGEKKEQAQEQTHSSGKQGEDDQFGRYLSEIRTLNDRIDDAVISAKIDRIEGITSHIFEIVRRKPEKLGEIRKFMNYYLPTTLKLLDSYALLEEQGIEGENITASKEQISQIMDTLIKSFEQQLDQLFTTQAMDISSDIEVLENMMAADGLKESDFKLKKKAARR